MRIWKDVNTYALRISRRLPPTVSWTGAPVRASENNCYLCHEMEILIPNLNGLEKAAEQFLEAIGDNRLIAFYAPMGAGKTTFITALCKVLGISGDAVSSPTFAIVNEYRASDGEQVFHFDFYRIEKDAEALDIGLYDYLDSGALCLMEWPENIENLLPQETLKVKISVNPDGSRLLSWDN